MKGRDVLFSRKSDEWETPKSILDKIKDHGWNIAIDLACTEENKVAPVGIYNFNDETASEIRLNDDNEICFCNPPYSNISYFLDLITKHKLPTILLLPARTDTKWFHNYVNGVAHLQFIKGRLKFSDSQNSAPFPSMIAAVNLRDGGLYIPGSPIVRWEKINKGPEEIIKSIGDLCDLAIKHDSSKMFRDQGESDYKLAKHRLLLARKRVNKDIRELCSDRKHLRGKRCS